MTERAGLRSRRERMSSAVILSPVNSWACGGYGKIKFGLSGQVAILFRPSGASSSSTAYPRLAPWAAFLRRFAADSIPSCSELLAPSCSEQGRAASGDGVLLDRQQDCGFVFYSAAETEPCGQRDAAGGLLGQSPRSRMIMPKPPLSRSKSVARRTCSRRCSDCRIRVIEFESGLRGTPHFSRKRRARNGAPFLAFASILGEHLSAAAHPQQSVQFHTGG